MFELKNNISSIKFHFFILLKVILFFILIISIQSEKPEQEEYSIKAGFLISFPKYIDWPPKSNVNDLRKPFVIGVIGYNQFKNQLEYNASIAKIKNKSIKIIYFNSPNEINECDLIFISKCSEKEFRTIINKVRKKSILTVSDNQDFNTYNAMISFYMDNKKVKFYINDELANESGLQLSYKLMERGTRIRSGDYE